MVDFFSNHFSDQSDATRQTNAASAVITVPDVHHKIPPGMGHGRLRVKIAHSEVLLLVATADTLRVMTFKSNDRLHALFLTIDDAGATGDIDMGLALSGPRNDGAVQDVNLFGTATDVNAAALDRVDQFAAGDLAAENRGFMMWELLAIGAGTDVVDPHVQYDLIITASELMVTLSDLVIEAHYTSGD